MNTFFCYTNHHSKIVLGLTWCFSSVFVFCLCLSRDWLVIIMIEYLSCTNHGLQIYSRILAHSSNCEVDQVMLRVISCPHAVQRYAIVQAR